MQRAELRERVKQADSVGWMYVKPETAEWIDKADTPGHRKGRR